MPPKKKKKDNKTFIQLSPEKIKEARALQKRMAIELHQLKTWAVQRKKRDELYKRL